MFGVWTSLVAVEIVERARLTLSRDVYIEAKSSSTP
jgi:hypothetical protein